MMVAGGATFYVYTTFAALVDERLHGERERSLPRVHARPVELRRGQALSLPDLVARLNDLGYSQRERVERAGEFTVGRDLVELRPRSGEASGRIVRATFTPARTPSDKATPAPSPVGIKGLEVDGSGARESVQIDAPVLTALMSTGTRQKRRHMPLSAIPIHVQHAVLAIEDQSFYSHPGINPFPVLATLATNLLGLGDRPLGSSTITQQLSRMFFLSDEFNQELRRGERSYWRKAREGVMSLVLERRTSKAEILELYLNDVYLGQRGSFAIHGVAEAARLFFGKDVSNLTIAEGALIAGVIQSRPRARRSPMPYVPSSGATW